MCMRAFTQLTAPAPGSLVSFLPLKRKRASSRQFTERSRRETLEKFLSDGVKSQGLPQQAAEQLRLFITGGCMPLPVEVNEAIDTIKTSIGRLRKSRPESKVDPRWVKRFDDVSRILKHLSNLVQMMYTIGVPPLFGTTSTPKKLAFNCPLFVSIDLGLRQKRRHFHGQVIFQCICIPDNYFDEYEEYETNDAIISSSGSGLKVAEGGRYDELVRRYRPPGNFGSALFNYYNTAPIPKVRIRMVAVIKFVSSSQKCIHAVFRVTFFNRKASRANLHGRRRLQSNGVK